MNYLDAYNLVKKHGLYKGLKTINDKFYENYLFDLANKLLTIKMVVKKNIENYLKKIFKNKN